MSSAARLRGGKAGGVSHHQKLYRSASMACELRRYWPRKSDSSPRISVKPAVPRQCAPNACEYSSLAHTPCPFCRTAVSSATLRLVSIRSEEHTSELQSPCNLVCRLLLEKK